MIEKQEITTTKKKQIRNIKKEVDDFLGMIKSTDKVLQKGTKKKKRLRQEDCIKNEFTNNEAKRKKLDDNLPEKPKESANKPSKTLLSKDELIALKTRLRIAQKLKMQKPLFYLKKIGLDAEINKNKNEPRPLYIQDIQHLLSFATIGDRTPIKPRWCELVRRSKVSHSVVLVIEGLSKETYLSHKECFPKTTQLFDETVEIFPPAQYDCCVAEELLCVPVSKNEMVKMIKKRVKRKNILSLDEVHESFRTFFTTSANREILINTTVGSTDKFPRTQLLLSSDELIREGYPMPNKESNSHFVYTKDEYEEVTDSSPMFGLDCEMCLTCIKKNELTRISIVDEDHNVVYDTLVKPPNRIINYLTQFSGITAKMMWGVTTTLADVQQKIREVLPPDAILCGQSLNFDLLAIEMIHPYVIDTSVIFNLSGRRNAKPGLKRLSATFLGLTIQNDPTLGHCSVEDSLSTLKLVQLKLQHSLDYGDAVYGGFIPSSPEPLPEKNKNLTDSNLIDNDLTDNNMIDNKNYEDVPSCLRNTTGLVTSYFDHLKEFNLKVALVGSEEALAQCSLEGVGFDESENVTKFVAETNKTVAELLRNKSREHSFSLGQMNMMRTFANSNKKQKSFKKLDRRISKLYQCLASNALFVVIFSGAMSKSGYHNALCQIKLKTKEIVE